MKRIGLFWKLYPSYLLIAIIALGGMYFYASDKITDFYYNRSKLNLETSARLAESYFFDNGKLKDRASIDALCRKLFKDSGIRITVISTSGEVLGDSIENPAKMENHSDRPEIKTAMNGNTGYSVRHSSTIDSNIIYAAVPVSTGNKTRLIIRSSHSVKSVEEALNKTYRNILFGGIVFAVFAAMLSLIAVRRINKPMIDLEQAAGLFAKGDLNHRAPVFKTREFASLSNAMNKMAEQLNGEISNYQRQKNEMDSILFSMVEGLIAVDEDEKIIKMNSAASEYIGVSSETAVGKHIQGAVRSTKLQEFVTSTLKSGDVIEKEILFTGERGDRFFQAHGTPLKDTTGKIMGALIVLNDLTKLQKLENIRRDFVANVSHEFKTPLTSIKGSAETLLGGAWKDKESRDNFLEIIIKSSDRLYAIVEDLLSLSRIERQSEKDEIILKRQKVKDVLESALLLYRVQAKEKKIKLTLKCEEELEAEMDAAMIEQAVANLVDNAIKFSEEGSDVKIACESQEHEIVISVEDRGRGISEEHLPRIFERFYRIDKGRGDKNGGTGLGLAIVKHTVEAHEGRVSVESKPGRGSLFKIHLPAVR